MNVKEIGFKTKDGDRYNNLLSTKLIKVNKRTKIRLYIDEENISIGNVFNKLHGNVDIIEHISIVTNYSRIDRVRSDIDTFCSNRKFDNNKISVIYHSFNGIINNFSDHILISNVVQDYNTLNMDNRYLFVFSEDKIFSWLDKFSGIFTVSKLSNLLFFCDCDYINLNDCNICNEDYGVKYAFDELLLLNERFSKCNNVIDYGIQDLNEFSCSVYRFIMLCDKLGFSKLCISRLLFLLYGLHISIKEVASIISFLKDIPFDFYILENYNVKLNKIISSELLDLVIYKNIIGSKYDFVFYK